MGVQTGGNTPDGASQKQAGATTFLVTELGKARALCENLVGYVGEAARLIDKSSHRDHFYEVAGHLISGVPDSLHALQQGLEVVALAANRLDAEAAKKALRPETVEELERATQDVRIRHVRSEPRTMDQKTVAQKLKTLAQETRQAGLPVDSLLDLVIRLENGVKVATSNASTADALEGLADHLASAEKGAVSRVQLAQTLRKFVGENVREAALDDKAIKRELKELVLDAEAMKGDLPAALQKGLAAIIRRAEGMMKKLASEDKESAKWIQKAIKDKGALHRHFGIPEDETIPTEKIKSELTKLRKVEDKSDAEKKLVHQLNMALTLRGPKVPPPKGKSASEEKTKESRFEEGVPADPTENMSEEDAKKWKDENEKNRDKFKSAADAKLTSALRVPWYYGLMTSKEPLQKVDPQSRKFRMSVLNSLETLANSKDQKSAAQALVLATQNLWEALYYAGAALAAREAEVDRVLSLHNASEDSTEKIAETEEQSRFEEGKPADPTKNMSPEDAKKWKENVDHDGSNIKKKGAEEAAPVVKALQKVMAFAEKDATNLVNGARAGHYDIFDELKYSLEAMNRMGESLKRTADNIGRFTSGKAALSQADSLIKAISQDVVDAFGYISYIRTIARLTTSEEIKGLTIKLAAEGDKESAQQTPDNNWGGADPWPYDVILPETVVASDPSWKTGGKEKIEASQDKEAGKGQDHLTKKIQGMPVGTKVELSELARGYRGLFKELMSAAKGLAKKGLIEFDGISSVTVKQQKTAGIKTSATSMSENTWYTQTFQSGGDLYFYAQSQNKNKGWKGLTVQIGDSGKPQKAKKDSVHPNDMRLWKEVPEAQVPGDVKSKAKARMASVDLDADAWKA